MSKQTMGVSIAEKTTWITGHAALENVQSQVCHYKGNKSIRYVLRPSLIVTFIVDCAWGDWGAWSDCSITCGATGAQAATRSKDVEEADGGAPCAGSGERSQPCNIPWTSPCGWFLGGYVLEYNSYQTPF